MAKPWAPYVIQQGDHLEKLAFMRGAAAPDVWDHPQNGELKARRKSGHQLLPGDVLYLPDAPTDWLELRTGTTNAYSAKVPLKDLRLVVRDVAGPIAGAPYFVEGLPHVEGESPPSGTTGADGAIELKVPVTLREVTVVLPHRHLALVMRIGDLDPHDEHSGAAQRLKNLGYLSRGADANGDISRSVALFQVKHSLPVTGALDQPTMQALDDQVTS